MSSVRLDAYNFYGFMEAANRVLKVEGGHPIDPIKTPDVPVRTKDLNDLHRSFWIINSECGYFE